VTYSRSSSCVSCVTSDACESFASSKHVGIAGNAGIKVIKGNVGIERERREMSTATACPPRSRIDNWFWCKSGCATRRWCLVACKKTGPGFFGWWDVYRGVGPFPLTAFWLSVTGGLSCQDDLAFQSGCLRLGEPTRHGTVEAGTEAGVTHCTKCGLPFIFGVPRHPRSPSVDHIIPLSLGGDPFAPSNLRPVCYGCNSKGGMAIASGRVKVQRPITAHRW
jgi:hypothetical protein